MKLKLTLLLAVFAMIFGIVSCDSNDDLLAPSQEDLQVKKASVATNAEMVPNELLIKFKAGTSEEAKTAVLQKFQGKVKEKILTKMMERVGDREGITLVNMPGAALEALARVKGLPEIEYAEPNWIYTHSATSNDTYYTNGSLWGMYGDASPLKTNAFGSQAGEAWALEKTGSSTVYIGIIDEGYMYTHEDLAANAGTNPGEQAGNGLDDDGNGYVDDVYGWDFDGNNNTVFDGTSDDHGTHVAGTIGAVGGNGIGVAGVCWTSKITECKISG